MRIQPFLMSILCVGFFTFYNSPAQHISPENPANLRIRLIADNFSSWRPGTGAWEITGEVRLDPTNAQKLKSSPGTGIAVNGRDGRTTHLISKDDYGDIRLHAEFMVSRDSNSGIYFMGRYELQIYDSWEKASEYPGIECGGIYQRWDESRKPEGYEGYSPLVNASNPPGEWQWFDVLFRAPRFDNDGNKISNAQFVKVYHNGRLVHENVELTGPTRAALFQDESPTGPLMLQGDHGPVAYRNLWVASADINPFFAMDTGTRDENHRSPREQVDMLHALGYDGIDHTGCKDLEPLIARLDERGMRLFALYLDVWVGKNRNQYNDGLEEAIRLLNGRDVALWVPLRSEDFPVSSPEGDEYAVSMVEKIADLAAGSGLRVALYPHTGFWMEKVEDAIRIARKINRPNVGVTFNLCHWLKVSRREELNSVLKEAFPFLSMVTINGADAGDSWKQLIQPLGSGDYDVFEVIKYLRTLKYGGPIGLQGYGIGGDVLDNLGRSMNAWRSYQGRFVHESR